MIIQKEVQQWAVDLIEAAKIAGLKAVQRIGRFEIDTSDPRSIAKFVAIAPCALVEMGNATGKDLDSTGSMSATEYDMYVWTLTRMAGPANVATSDAADAMAEAIEHALKGQLYKGTDYYGELRWKGTATGMPEDHSCLILAHQFCFLAFD
jgi:hypothetical protein